MVSHVTVKIAVPPPAPIHPFCEACHSRSRFVRRCSMRSSRVLVRLHAGPYAHGPGIDPVRRDQGRWAVGTEPPGRAV